MKSCSNSILIILLLVVVSCNPGGIDRYSSHANPKLPAINTYQENPEHCSPELPVPGTEDAVSVGSTFEAKSCEKVCFKNYQVLPENHSPEAYLSFPTPSYLGAGRCRGHAIVTQQFTMLGRFGAGDNPEKCGPKKMNYSCLNFYKGIIEDITSGKKVRDIPGFRSLLEFSFNPQIKRLLYQKVISYSYRFSAGMGSVEKKVSDKNQNVFYEIFKRAKNNQRPYLGIKGVGLGDHAVLVSKAAFINGKQVLCVSDPNERDYETYDNRVCDNHIKLEGGGAIYVSGGKSRYLTKFNIFSDEDDRTVDYVNAWNERCRMEKEVAGECKSKSPLNI
jgi:hypothetical protein